MNLINKTNEYNNKNLKIDKNQQLIQENNYHKNILKIWKKQNKLLVILLNFLIKRIDKSTIDKLSEKFIFKKPKSKIRPHTALNYEKLEEK